jgi:hypothetical protein
VDILEPWRLTFGQEVDMKSPALVKFADTFAMAASQLPQIVDRFGPAPAPDTPAREGWLSNVLGFVTQNPWLLDTIGSLIL